jgi:hypothetical protein
MSRILWGLVALFIAAVILGAAFYSGIIAQRSIFRSGWHYLDRKKLSVCAGVMNEDSQQLGGAASFQPARSNTSKCASDRRWVVVARSAEVEGNLMILSPLAASPISTSTTSSADRPHRPWASGAQSKYNDDAMFSWHHFRAYDVMAVKRPTAAMTCTRVSRATRTSSVSSSRYIAHRLP